MTVEKDDNLFGRPLISQAVLSPESRGLDQEAAQGMRPV